LTGIAQKEGETEMGLVTENLHLSAYALANGAKLKTVSVSRTNGRRTAVFELESPYIHKLADEYYGEAAVVNLAEYRRHLEELKDQLFEALRQDESRTKTRRQDAYHQQGSRRGA
jgi:hypothetical protein